MPYSVVETKKANAKKTNLAAVPDGWVDSTSNLVYWPRIDYAVECANENSVFSNDRIPNIIIKVWHTKLETRQQAEDLVDHYLNKTTDSERESERQESDDDDDLNMFGTNQMDRRNKKNIHQTPKGLPRQQAYSLITPNCAPPVSDY